MIKNAQNKMISPRDQFIIDKAKQDFTPTEIIILLKKNDFAPVNRSRIYQILASNGIKSK